MKLRTLLAASLLLSAALPAFAAEPGCPALDSWGGFAWPLNHARVAVKSARRLTIVAIGSSSTYGTGASSRAMSYPRQLEKLLDRELPGITIHVLNKGVPGELATATIGRFGRDVASQRPDLVIWQVGTNEVVENRQVGRFRKLVEDGIQRLKRTGADVVVMDPQYAPLVVQRADHDEVVADVDGAARDAAVNLLPRFALMHHWIEAGRFTPTSISGRDGLHMNDASYLCLAEALDGALVQAMTISAPMATAR